MRIVRLPVAPGWSAGLLAALAIAALVLAWALRPSAPGPGPARALAGAGAQAEPAPEAQSVPEPIPMGTPASPASAPRAAPASQEPTPGTPWASPDRNDLANYIPPGTPEPRVAEVIEALHAAGDKGGLGAFNPPGTSPLLQGLAVPPDFELPPGYVRHHQVSDAGEPIEAILMYSPDFEFRDAAGNPLPIPENRVVPPEMAPPGLPIRAVELPPPPQ